MTDKESKVIPMTNAAQRIRFDLNRWSYRDLMQFLNAMQASDFKTAADLAMPIIISWTYKQPIALDKPFGGLSFFEGVEVLNSIMETIAVFNDGIKTHDVEADLSVWLFDDFTTFQDAIKANNFMRVEAMLRQVVKFPDLPADVPLPAIDGVKAMKVVSEIVKKTFAGKR